jgi:DNA-binding YbaB/EbfC family protein
MGTFGKMKDMYKLQKQAKSLKKELKNIHIESDEKGVVIILDGEQNIISITIPDEALQNKKILEESIKRAFEKALKKSQQITAEKMKGAMGGDLSGLLGG